MPKGNFQGDSSYHDTYIQKEMEKNKQFRPEQQLKVGGKFEGSSSYGADYIPKEGNLRAERSALPHNEVMPKGQFAGHSTYG